MAAGVGNGAGHPPPGHRPRLARLPRSGGLAARPRRMNHADHVALIRDGVTGAGPRWLELGAGTGAFTLALLDLLGAEAEVTAVDRDPRALGELRRVVDHSFPSASLRPVEADFTRPLPLEAGARFDGVLMAN